MIPQIGDKIAFIPSAYTHGAGSGAPGSEEAREFREKSGVTGTVVQVNLAHGWYRVAYETEYNGTQYECFHFYPERGGV